MPDPLAQLLAQAWRRRQRPPLTASPGPLASADSGDQAAAGWSAHIVGEDGTWTAVVTVPGLALADDTVPVRVVRDVAPDEAAVLELCSLRLPLLNGRALVPLSDLLPAWNGRGDAPVAVLILDGTRHHGVVVDQQ